MQIFTHHFDSRCRPASFGSDGASVNEKSQRYSLRSCTSKAHVIKVTFIIDRTADIVDVRERI